MKLNLGCGDRKLPGYVNVDCYPQCAPDQLVDLEHLPWPWPDDSVDEVVLHHVLEHLGETRNTFIGIIKELWRICRAGAKVHVTVPDPRSDGFLGDPTHVRAITPAVLQLFSQSVNRQTLAKGWPNTPLGLIHGIDFDIESINVSLQEPWAGRHAAGKMTDAEVHEAMRTYFNVVNETVIVLVARKG